MISFMVLAGPRSATTWMANLLTTDTTLCMHDPSLEHRIQTLDQIGVPGKRLGIADTSALLWPDWLEKHPAKKVVLWRDPAEINTALRALGMRELDRVGHSNRIGATLHWKNVRIYSWASVFQWKYAKSMCDFLGVPVDEWRYRELVKMNIQPQFQRLPLGKEAVQELVRRLAEELK